jgi:oligopeptide/dipeptide ABC transporter ATP-binding protein
VVNPLVEVSNLKKEFQIGGKNQRVHAVDGVSLTIETGEIVGLVGESGCGKTTLGRCVLRLIEPTSGSVRFSGEDISGYKGEKLRTLRRRMQIVFQDPFASLDPRWRVYEILEEPLRVHKMTAPRERKAEIIRLLADVGLGEDAVYRFPHEFSGGQRQRIGIARSIALRPEFLVADEPVSALDVSVRAQILNLLLKLRQDKGISILFIGHDLGVVRQICTRIAVMYLGIVVEMASADELFENPRHPYTRALLSAIPSILNIGSKQNRQTTASGDVPSPINIPSGCRFRARCQYAKSICAEEQPALIGDGHQIACHFAGELPVLNSQTIFAGASANPPDEGTI